MASVASLIIFLHPTCAVFLLYFYFRIFSAFFLITFLSPEIATSIKTRVSSSLFRIMLSGLLLGMFLSFCSFGFHNMIILPARCVFTNFGTCWYQCPFSNFTLFPCIWWSVVERTLSCLFISFRSSVSDLLMYFMFCIIL
jgi:hypothetical protein